MLRQAQHDKDYTMYIFNNFVVTSTSPLVTLSQSKGFNIYENGIFAFLRAFITISISLVPRKPLNPIDSLVPSLNVIG